MIIACTDWKTIPDGRPGRHLNSENWFMRSGRFSSRNQILTVWITSMPSVRWRLVCCPSSHLDATESQSVVFTKDTCFFSIHYWEWNVKVLLFLWFFHFQLVNPCHLDFLTLTKILFLSPGDVISGGTRSRIRLYLRNKFFLFHFKTFFGFVEVNAFLYQLYTPWMSTQVLSKLFCMSDCVQFPRLLWITSWSRQRFLHSSKLFRWNERNCAWRLCWGKWSNCR